MRLASRADTILVLRKPAVRGADGCSLNFPETWRVFGGGMHSMPIVVALWGRGGYSCLEEEERRKKAIYSRSLQAQQMTRWKDRHKSAAFSEEEWSIWWGLHRGHLGRPRFQAGDPHWRRGGKAEFVPYSHPVGTTAGNFSAGAGSLRSQSLIDDESVHRLGNSTT